MSFPREYLTFTIWYLQESSLIRMTKTSDFALTAGGVNHVEASLNCYSAYCILAGGWFSFDYKTGGIAIVLSRRRQLSLQSLANCLGNAIFRAFWRAPFGAPRLQSGIRASFDISLV